MVSLGGLVGAVVMAGFGAVVAWNGWTAHTDERELVGDAVDVTAEVKAVGSSRTEERVDVDGGGSHTRTRHVPRIEFEYTYDGASYTASNVDPPADGVDTVRKYSSESRARAHLDEYEEGERVTAYVDPDRPGEGFLEAETNTVRNLVTVLFGGAVVLIGGVFFGYSLVVA